MPDINKHLEQFGWKQPANQRQKLMSTWRFPLHLRCSHRSHRMENLFCKYCIGICSLRCVGLWLPRWNPDGAVRVWARVKCWGSRRALALRQGVLQQSLSFLKNITRKRQIKLGEVRRWNIIPCKKGDRKTSLILLAIETEIRCLTLYNTQVYKAFNKKQFPEAFFSYST